MQGGRTLQRFVAVPEGWPSVMVHDAVMAAPQLEGQVAVPQEGSMLPDSYSYERGDTRASVVDADAGGDDALPRGGVGEAQTHDGRARRRRKR